jgi:glycosyltransferase involved in cell wall biosynthesis
MDKKILLCIPGSYVAGAEMTNIETLKLLKSKGNRLYCIINKWNDGEFKKNLKEQEIRFTEIKIGVFYLSKILWTINSLIHFIPAVFKFIKVYYNFKPDSIYFCSQWYFFLFARWFKPGKTIYREHNYPKDTKRNLYFYKFLNKYADSILVDSNYVKERLLNFGVKHSKIFVAPSLVNDQSDYLPNFNNNKKINVGIVGQVLSRKGHDILLNALALLNEETRSRIHLWIIGPHNKPFKVQLDEIIVEKLTNLDITFTDHIIGVENIYKKFGLHLVIVPSRIEAFGRVALEPAFSAIPVIASNTGGLPEIIINKHTGFLFEKENIQKLAGYLELYLHDKELMEKHGQNAKFNAINNFSYDKLAKKTLCAFE